MLDPQDTPAVSRLRNFISELQAARTPQPTFFTGLKDLEITIEQLVEREEELTRLDDLLAQWVASVPSDFTRPTFEQLVAHLVAIIFALNRAFFHTRRARDLSRDRRPVQLQDNLGFLRDYLLQEILRSDLLPSYELKRGCFMAVADLLTRYGVPAVGDDEDLEQFERLPAHQFILELYMRARKNPRKYKDNEYSLEFRLLQAGAFERLCRQWKGLGEFIGPDGLDLYYTEGWWARLRRGWHRQWEELRKGTKYSALYAEYMLIFILLVFNLLLFLAVWMPQVHSAEESVSLAKDKMITAITNQVTRSAHPSGR